MDDQKTKILGMLRSSKADVDEAYNWSLAETINRMAKEGFSDDQIRDATEYMRLEKEFVLEEIENRIKAFKEENDK